VNRSIVLIAAFSTLLLALVILVYLNFFAAPEATEPGPPPPIAATERELPPGAMVAEPLVAAPTAGDESATVTERSMGPRDGEPALPAMASPSVAGGPLGPGRLMLYFQGADVGLLFPEERAAEPARDGHQRARQVLAELDKGPTKDLLPTVPEGTEVREIYFDSSGVAYVDFSRELRDNHPGGSSEELMTIESIVNTLARNVPQVQAVRFLVDGRAVTTLTGHVNLSIPLRPSSDRIALTP